MVMDTLRKISHDISECTRCPLHLTRTHPVPGEGPDDARVMFIGEAPGRQEDQTGRPFVGSAGKVLDGWLFQLGLSRDKVFITSVLKCRPPNNRNPTSDEINTCSVYLDRQIDVIKPRVIFLLGRFAIRYAVDRFNLPQNDHVSEYVGKTYNYEQEGLNLLLIPFYHPAYLIYNKKKEVEVTQLLKRLRVIIGTYL